MINVYCFYCDDSTLSPYDADVRILRDVLGLVRDGLPDVAIYLDTSKTVGLDRLHYPALTTQQGIGITHTVVLTLVQIALGKGPYPEEADQREHGENGQLHIEA